jgi:hypothetical protein
LYHNECTGKFEYIPYDLDNTFGIDWFGIDWTSRNIYTWGNTNEYRPLFERIIEQSEFKDQLSKIIERLINDEFKGINLNSEIEKYRSLIKDLVAEDPYYPLDYGYDINDFNLSFDQGLGAHVPFGLKEYINLRGISAQAQLINSNPEPLAYFVDFNYPDAEAEGVLFRSKIWEEPVSQVKLFTKKGGESWISNSMLDNGLNGDEVAGDYLYSFELSSWSYGEDLQYYIEITTPGGKMNRYPECDNYSVDFTTELPSLYLNEWMASNKSIIQDEAGNYPDWIELYNSGNKPIYLGDKYLSDDAGDRTKWRMPDAVIYPGQFFLFWADNDEDEGEFHTNFKLSISGEHIGIYDTKSFDHRQIDAVEFGPQSEDISEGLLTDGGEVIVFFNEPTPKASNEPLSTLELVGMDVDVFPNPASDYFKIRNEILQNIDLQIYTYDGKLVFEKNIIGNELLISTDGWNAGNYILKLFDVHGRVEIKKLVILP